MIISFSYYPEGNCYFANANLPVAIKNVSLHVNLAITAMPKMTLRVSYENMPIQIIQGDFRIDSSVTGKLLAVLSNLNGKTVMLYLTFEPNVSTISLPYLEIQYVPFSLEDIPLVWGR